MSNAAKHRKKAAEFEQLKQIDRAIASYVRAIEESEADGEDVDVALLNKVGDLALRQGRVPDAVTYYERAVEHYATAGLFNNAIALCNKILRNAPGRSNVYFTLGRICARKGLRGDATRNFLEYAARMQQEGRVEEAMRALGEVADLMPELTEVRRLVDEHAVRAGVELPRRRTPLVTEAVSAPEAPRFAGDKSSNLVFLEVDYSAASARLTPPIPPRAQRELEAPRPVAEAPARVPVKTPPIVLPFIDLDAPQVATRSGSPALPLVELVVDTKPATPAAAGPQVPADDARPVDSAAAADAFPDTGSAQQAEPLENVAFVELPMLDLLGSEPEHFRDDGDDAVDGIAALPTLDLPMLDMTMDELPALDRSSQGEALLDASVLDMPSLDMSSIDMSSIDMSSIDTSLLDASAGDREATSETPDGDVREADVPDLVTLDPMLLGGADLSPIDFEPVVLEHFDTDAAPPAAEATLDAFIATPIELNVDTPALEVEPAEPQENLESNLELEQSPNMLGDSGAEVREEPLAAPSGNVPDVAPRLTPTTPPSHSAIAHAVPGDSTPGAGTPASGDGTFDIPAEVTSASVTPAYTTPASISTTHVTPAYTTPAYTTPAHETPTGISAAPVTPAYTTPAYTTPASVTPANVTPKSVTPASVTPASVTPASATPASATPATAPPALRTRTPLSASPIPAIEAAIAAGAEVEARAAAEQPATRRPPFRLDPHDFILPGELPPLVVDDALVEAGLQRARAVATSLPTPIASVAFVTPVGTPRLVPRVDTPTATERVDALDTTAIEVARSREPEDAVPLDVATAFASESVGAAGETIDAPADASADSQLAAREAGIQASPFAPDVELAGAPASGEATADFSGTDNDSRDDVDADADPDADAELERAFGAAVRMTPSLPIGAVAAEANAVAESRRDELRAAVATRPQDWALRRRLAEALFEAGQRDAALAELEASLQGFVQAGQIADAADVSEMLVGVSPERVSYHQKRVELAVRLNDQQRLRFAYLDLADALVRSGEEGRAQAVYVRVLEIDPLDDRARAALGSAAPPLPPPRPTADEEGFVNLSDWLRDDEAPASTRMRMREPVVSGDEQADFAALLRHFKDGVSRSLGDEDFESRYDLGVAFKEMGLLDDAIGEFQKALRSKTHRLPAYEALGQCFVEQGRYQVAATVLSRALHEPGLNDEHRVGVLYLLAYSCEALQRWGEARSYFQRVYATDINFRDVAARLAALEQVAS